jgi:hypothetical protein
MVCYEGFRYRQGNAASGGPEKRQTFMLAVGPREYIPDRDTSQHHNAQGLARDCHTEIGSGRFSRRP